jgi:DNA invertase Pin-like site-specific DNA recombinase
MNSYVYIRCSTGEQTPELQLNDISTMVNIESVEIHIEQVSAYKDNIKRPVFDAIRNDIKKGNVSILYVWHLDRIFRDRKKLLDFLSFCRLHKTKVLSYNQKFLEVFLTMPSPFDEALYDLMLQVIGWIAEEESTTKSKRVKLAVRKDVNGTYSHKGNKWGRKAFPKMTIDRVLKLHNEGNSLRNISSQIKVYDKNNNSRNISKSSVHKIISTFNALNHSKSMCPIIK